MSDLYLALKLVHILGATVLFGTGLGIAFFMFMAHRTGDPAKIAHTARIVVIAVKPSLLRWAVYDNMKKANALMRNYIDTHKGLEYVEVGPPMLGTDGKPRPELFVPDGLHMTAEGYKLWTALLRPHLN